MEPEEVAASLAAETKRPGSRKAAQKCNFAMQLKSENEGNAKLRYHLISRAATNPNGTTAIVKVQRVTCKNACTCEIFQ